MANLYRSQQEATNMTAKIKIQELTQGLVSEQSIWLDLENHDEKTLYEEFGDFIITDYDDIPSFFFNKNEHLNIYTLNSKFWEWKILSKPDQELCELYWKNICPITEIQSIKEKHCGFYFDAKEWSESVHFEDIPERIKKYINYDEMLEDARRYEGLVVIDVDNGFQVFFG